MCSRNVIPRIQYPASDSLRGLINASTFPIFICPTVMSGKVVLYPIPGPAAVVVLTTSPRFRLSISAVLSSTPQKLAPVSTRKFMFPIFPILPLTKKHPFPSGFSTILCPVNSTGKPSPDSDSLIVLGAESVNFAIFARCSASANSSSRRRRLISASFSKSSTSSLEVSESLSLFHHRLSSAIARPQFLLALLGNLLQPWPGLYNFESTTIVSDFTGSL